MLPPKPYHTYPQLITLLENRGMQIHDKVRAERKISQVGYYRLSGYWYPCRILSRKANGDVITQYGKPVREDRFEPGTSFDAVFDLYLFDKKLRQLMLDGIERIEVNVRTIIAHEVGKHDPLAYEMGQFINPNQRKTFIAQNKQLRNIWNEWLIEQQRKLSRSREDCIVWHKNAKKSIPFWVAVEAWDFGTMSKYFEILKGSHQNKIATKLQVNNPRSLSGWLKEINTLRNRCAHHTRIWNQASSNPVTLENNGYFNNLGISPAGSKKLYGLISVIWYLIQNIGPNSQWIHEVADLIDSKPALPGCDYEAMGLPQTGFPRAGFGI